MPPYLTAVLGTTCSFGKLGAVEARSELTSSPVGNLKQAGADSQNMATCASVGVYADALTYGNEYEILARDVDKHHVKVRADNGRARWYPEYCFDMSGQQMAMLVRATVDDLDDLVEDFLTGVDVVLEFSDGQRRWCFFITPELLSRLGGAEQVGDERLLSYNVPHMIVVSAITREIIDRSLAFIESQGELLDSSMPIV